MTAAHLPDVDVDPCDTSSFVYGGCRRARAEGSEPPTCATASATTNLRAHDAELDGGPPVPPLVDLTVFGDNRIEIDLRRSDDGWRAVRVVFDDSCTTGPDR